MRDLLKTIFLLLGRLAWFFTVSAAALSGQLGFGERD
jgi:hypothetical protein